MTRTINCRLAHATLLAAMAAAGFSVATAHAVKPGTVRIIELSRVTVVARRLPTDQLATVVVNGTPKATSRIILLPPVMVIARRESPASTLVAERMSRANRSGV